MKKLSCEFMLLAKNIELNIAQCNPTECRKLLEQYKLMNSTWRVVYIANKYANKYQN
jgi:hypothetical protein